MADNEIDWDRVLEEAQGKTPYEKFQERIDEVHGRFRRGIERSAQSPNKEE